jgi:hypothetical protein
MKIAAQPVERRQRLGRAEFHEAFLERNRPVILTDEVARWPASRLWTDDYLIDRFGRHPVDGDVHADGMYTAHHPVKERTTLGTVLAGSRIDPRRGSLVVHVLTRAPYLIPDYSIPTVVAPEEVESSGFWIKPRLATSGLHFDHQNGLVGVIRGRKRFLLFSPDQVDRMYPCPVQGIADNIKRNWSAVVDVFNPDYSRFPQLAEAVCHEVVLEAGEMLFIPKFWWHAVSHLADLTLSINFFLVVTQGGRWPLFYDDRVLIERLLGALRGQ